MLGLTYVPPTARQVAENEEIEVRYYGVIYNLLDEVKQALSGMLAPETKEEIVGIAEVRDVFRSPKFGAIAGCMVVEGSVFHNKPIRVLRDEIVIFQGELESLRRFKRGKVRNGMECGIGVKDYNDVKAGDLIEVYDITQVSGRSNNRVIMPREFTRSERVSDAVQKELAILISENIRDPRVNGQCH